MCGLLRGGERRLVGNQTEHLIWMWVALTRGELWQWVDV